MLALAFVIMHPKNTHAHVHAPGHPLDGRLVEVVGRGRGVVVYVKLVMGDPNEYTLNNDQIKEIKS